MSSSLTCCSFDLSGRERERERERVRVKRAPASLILCLKGYKGYKRPFGPGRAHQSPLPTYCTHTGRIYCTHTNHDEVPLLHPPLHSRLLLQRHFCITDHDSEQEPRATTTARDLAMEDDFAESANETTRGAQEEEGRGSLVQSRLLSG